MWKIRRIASKGDYNYAVVPEHPNKTKDNYVLEHRVIMENSIGRLLGKNEVVHHINKDKKDNRIENLELMDSKEHVRKHSSTGRVWVMLKCPCCDKIFNKGKNNTFLSKGGKYTSCSRSCHGKFSRNMVLSGKTEEIKRAIEGNIILEYRYFK